MGDRFKSRTYPLNYFYTSLVYLHDDINIRPNKKNILGERAGFFLKFYSFFKFFNSIFWGDGGGFSTISVIFFILMLRRPPFCYKNLVAKPTRS